MYSPVIGAMNILSLILENVPLGNSQITWHNFKNANDNGWGENMFFNIENNKEFFAK